jgi:hypothetical protein
MMMPRVVAVETLDHLEANDPAAQRSRRDLVRIHRAMGTRSIIVRGWQALVSSRRAAAALRILEIGAGDGKLLLSVARSMAPAWPRVRLTLLDRQSIVSQATLASYADLGWAAEVEVADVLDWAARSAPAAPGSSSTSWEPWDLITTTLFLHHFQGAQLDELLGAISTRAVRFFACEPRRARLALAASHLVGAIGANAVTREDAVLSVRAGFRDTELTALWPGSPSAWQTREHAAGLFSHCFSAQRSESV